MYHSARIRQNCSAGWENVGPVVTTNAAQEQMETSCMMRTISRTLVQRALHTRSLELLTVMVCKASFIQMLSKLSCAELCYRTEIQQISYSEGGLRYRAGPSSGFAPMFARQQRIGPCSGWGFMGPISQDTRHGTVTRTLSQAKCKAMPNRVQRVRSTW